MPAYHDKGRLKNEGTLSRGLGCDNQTRIISICRRALVFGNGVVMTEVGQQLDLSRLDIRS